MEIFQNMVKIVKSVWKVCEECVRVYEGVHESVWEYFQGIPKLKYIPLDTKLAEIGQKRAKIGKNVWKVCEKCVRSCKGLCESIKSLTNEFPGSSTYL